MGNLYVVVFSPEDIKTAKEAPSLRRGFLDGEISKIRPSYVDALKNYTKIIAEKNAVLRRKEEKNKKTLLEAYNEQLSGYIRIILKNRKAYVKKLNEYVKKTHSEISGGREQIKITYKETIPEEEIKETLTRLIPCLLYTSSAATVSPAPEPTFSTGCCAASNQAAAGTGESIW